MLGYFEPLAQPRNTLRGTGFVIGDGLHVVTNHHVLPDILDAEKRQQLVIFCWYRQRSKSEKGDISGIF